MFDFFNRLFGPPPSSQTAKERLRLVLLSDHLSLAPDVVENLKRDLLEVISRYVEVDVANCDVSFEQRDKEVAMLANIPILGMHKRPAPPSVPPPIAPVPPMEPTPGFEAAGAQATVAAPSGIEKPKVQRKPATAANGNGATTGSVSTNANGTSRRRRRKAPSTPSAPKPQLSQSAPQPT